jgi:membrane protein implicated in regulation of membrane protease activity
MVAWQVWLVLAVIFTIIETATTTFFIFWFGVGAAAAALVAYLGGHFVLQMLVFFVVSLALVAYTRPFARRVQQNRTKTNVDALPGRTGIALERIDGHGRTGVVKVNGETWTAIVADDGVVKKGQRVTVLGIDGVKLVVRPLPGESNPEAKPHDECE